MSEAAEHKICTNCKYENPVGALICRRCYHPLVNFSTGDSTRKFDLPGKTENDTVVPPDTDRLPPGTSVLQTGQRIRLRLPEFAKEIEIDLSARSSMIGRTDKARGITPNIDLSEYEAAENGVSRCHAIFQRQGNKVYVVDLNSSNGTFVNGHKLRGSMPNRLQDSDVVRFGKLETIVYFVPG